MDPSDDVFDSVTWETPSAGAYEPSFVEAESAPTGPGFRREGGDRVVGSSEPKWEGYLLVQVKDPIKELEGTKDMYISYLVTAQVSCDGSSYWVHSSNFVNCG
jgi:sorting nexin-4